MRPPWPSSPLFDVCRSVCQIDIDVHDRSDYNFLACCFLPASCRRLNHAAAPSWRHLETEEVRRALSIRFPHDNSARLDDNDRTTCSRKEDSAALAWPAADHLSVCFGRSLQEGECSF